MCIATNCSWAFVYWVIILQCNFVTSCILFYCTVCTAVLHTLVAGLLARSQYPGGHATGHLGTGFSWFHRVQKWMLRLFPRLKVATACFSCSPPDLNFLDPAGPYTHAAGSKLHCQTPTKHTIKYLWITTSNFSQAQLCTPWWWIT